MQVRRFSQVKEFWQQAQGYLLSYPAEHNLLLGMMHTLLHSPERPDHLPYLAIATSNETILAVAICTPPYKLVLSKAQDLTAIRAIAEDLQHQPQPLPGVSGLVAEVETFLQTWQTLTGQSYRRVMAMRIHQLAQVDPIVAASGQLRLATEGDRPLLIEWFNGFAAEMGEVVSQNAEQAITSGLKRQSIYIWQDGVPVSWANGSQILATAGRIGPVYTPLKFRRQGYATACVAALSQRLLAQGCDRCFLFTDLANPTSNRIYRQIGYQPVCDWDDYSLISKL